MALSQQHSNLISELMAWAANMLTLVDQGEYLIARWNQSSALNLLTDADVAAVFPHLTAGEANNCVTAIKTVVTALGNTENGQIVNLIKMKG
jgi:hypothetical protein